MANPNWKKGVSGNPAGRKPGTKCRKTLLRQEIEKHGAELIAVIKTAALENQDMSAAGMLLARLEAPLRPTAPLVQFDFDSSAPLAQQVESVLQAMADGKLPPDVANHIIDGINRLAGVRQFDELEARIKALEQHRS